jgi:hypothetical protein
LNTGPTGATGPNGASGNITGPTGGNALLEPSSNQTAGSGSITDTVTVGEAVVFGQLLYLKSDGKWWLTFATSATAMPARRMALEAKSADQACNTLRLGRVRNDSWYTGPTGGWAVGSRLYASTSTGAMTPTGPTGSGQQVQVVGVAHTPTGIIFDPDSTIVEVA